MHRRDILSNDLVADALYRRVALRIVPFLFVCYVANFIDRVNIGFAKLQFLDDLGLNDAVFGVAAGMFFVGYVIFEVPSNLLLARIGTRRTLMRIMVLWGGFTIVLAFVKGKESLYLLRFLLGLAEAGFFPGIVLYLTFWFPSARRGRVLSLFLLAVPFAGIVGGPLSGSIMAYMNGEAGLRGWQWLFILEGIPAVVLGVLSLIVLNDGPASAAWLSPAERSFIAAELEGESASTSSRITHYRELVRSPRLYAMAAIYFCVFTFANAVGFWIPTIMKAVGVQNVAEIGWIAGAIAACGGAGLLMIGFHSDRSGERRWHVAGSGLAGALSFFLLPLAVHSVILTGVLLAVASIAIYSVLSLFWTIPTAFLKGHAAPGGIAFISAFGALGGAISPVIVGTLKSQTGSLYAGLAVTGILIAIGMLALVAIVPPANSGKATRDH